MPDNAACCAARATEKAWRGVRTGAALRRLGDCDSHPSICNHCCITRATDRRLTQAGSAAMQHAFCQQSRELAANDGDTAELLVSPANERRLNVGATPRSGPTGAMPLARGLRHEPTHARMVARYSKYQRRHCQNLPVLPTSVRNRAVLCFCDPVIGIARGTITTPQRRRPSVGRFRPAIRRWRHAGSHRHARPPHRTDRALRHRVPAAAARR